MDGAIDELQRLPEGECQLDKKSIAEKREIDVRKLKGQTAKQRSRKCKKRLLGREIAIPCLPTTAEIVEKHKLSLVNSQ